MQRECPFFERDGPLSTRDKVKLIFTMLVRRDKPTSLKGIKVAAQHLNAIAPPAKADIQAI